ILFSRHTMQHASGPELFQECRILGIVGEFWFLFRVQVIKVAEELVEAVHGRQIFILIAKMVVTELTSGVAQRFEQLGDCWVFGLKPDSSTRHSNLGQSGAERVL